MLVDDVLYHFLDVALSGSASQGIADAVVLEVKLVVGLEDSFAMDVLYLVDEDIVVFTSIEVLIYVLVKVLVILDAIKISFLQHHGCQVYDQQWLPDARLHRHGRREG